LTTLVGASLLFAVEPMVAKMLLPAYGGSPMVWNTAVLFFQGALLVGYAYAHWSQRRLGARRQPLVHRVLVVLPMAVLPVALPAWSVAPESAPTALWLLLVLAVMVGAPFAVLATTGPLVQRWYSWSGLPRADDPYFLYAASNVGSLLALLSYPLLLEPAADVATQARWWAVCYVAFAALMVACAVLVRRQARSATDAPSTRTDTQVEEERGPTEQLGWRRRVRWLALAFVPSSLMLGVTTHISTDIAPVPLMWVVPLALYLVTFIVAFGVRRYHWLPLAVRLSALAAVVLPWTYLLLSGRNPAIGVGLDLTLLIVAGLACHGLLATDRPAPSRLTEFFLVVSLGGALGGVFNGLLAPVIFNWVAELPLVVSALGLLPLMLRARSGRAAWSRVRWAAFLLGGPAVVLVLCFATSKAAVIFLGIAVAVAWAAVLSRHPRMIAVVIVVGLALVFVVRENQAVVQERTFFGQYAVRVTPDRHVFAHGTTIHGFQLRAPSERMTPVSYYARRGPMGDIFATYGGRPASDRVAVVGLGAGGLAGYGRPGQRMDFYEIDPVVVRFARDERYFTYLRDCMCEARTIVGDGRLKLDEVADGSYGMIVLDAFSSDAVPAHLLTREAIRLYSRKLAPGGVLVFNVTNRNLDLAPMLGATAKAGGLVTSAADDPVKGDRISLPSRWVVAARSESDLDPLTSQHSRWRPIRPGGPVWTDAYSSLFGVLKLRTHR
jgi:SAM-dependent methyltransferase